MDGAQTLGFMPVDVKKLGCDLYAFPGHKGLLGPPGTGGLYIRPGLTLRTIREGGTGASSDSMRQNADGPERYESGTLNLPGIAGLSAGAGFVLRELEAINRHERALTDHLLRGLLSMQGVQVYGPLDAKKRAGLVSFNVNDFASGTVADALDGMGFAVRGGLHCAPGAHTLMGTLDRGAVRASVGHANTHDEIDGFLSAVQNCAGRTGFRPVEGQRRGGRGLGQGFGGRKSMVRWAAVLPPAALACARRPRMGAAHLDFGRSPPPFPRPAKIRGERISSWGRP